MTQKPQRFGHRDVRVVSEETLYQGFYRMHSYAIEHAGFQGGRVRIQRELMLRPDAVVVLPWDPVRDEVVLIEQFRVGGRRVDTPWLVECVAGLIDRDEPVEEVARREAQEEAGLALGRLHLISTYLPSPGACDEKVTLFVAEADTASAGGVHGLADEGEDILVHRVSRVQAMDWLAQGIINNAASIIALQWLALNLQDIQELWGNQ